MSTYEERMRRIDEHFNSEKYKKEMPKFFAEIERKRKSVSSQEYVEWFYNYVSNIKHLNDEIALYLDDDNDSLNGRMLGFFFDFVEELADKQRVLIVSDKESWVENEEVVVKIRDRYFELSRMYGQGSLTSAVLLDKEPDFCYVRLEVEDE